VEGFNRDTYVGVRGQAISEVDWVLGRLAEEEAASYRRERSLDKDTADLVEYVKWITGDLGILRDRVRIAEKIIRYLTAANNSC
jgi:hypothetical protein